MTKSGVRANPYSDPILLDHFANTGSPAVVESWQDGLEAEDLLMQINWFLCTGRIYIYAGEERNELRRNRSGVAIWRG